MPRSLDGILASLVMTRQTIDGCFPFDVAIHAEAHSHLDVALSDRLLRDVAVARRAFHFGANVRCVIEPHVRLSGVPKHALPREVDALLPHLGDLLDPRFIARDAVVTEHARPDAWKPRHGPLRHGRVTVRRTRNLPFDVHVVRELDRLYRGWPSAEEIVHRRSHRRLRRREHIRSLARQQRWSSGRGHVALEQSTAAGGDQRYAEDKDSGADKPAARCHHTSSGAYQRFLSWPATGSANVYPPFLRNGRRGIRPCVP